MAAHCSHGVGGAIEALVMPADREELKRVLAWASEQEVDYRFWGCGGGLVVREGGMHGLAIQMSVAFAQAPQVQVEGDATFAIVGAGAPVQDLVHLCEGQSLSGVEMAFGYRGTVAGALIRGVVGLADAVEEITILMRDGRELTMKGTGINRDRGLIKIPRTVALLRVRFRLARKEGVAEQESRASTQTPAELMHIAHVFHDDARVSAATLIDEVGLIGVRVGGARIWDEDANVIILTEQARARDVAVLVSLVRDRVRDGADVVLEPTISVIGEK